MSSIYTERAVLFIDILGMREIVKEGREDKILKCLSIPDSIPMDRIRSHSDMRLSAFSDSIIVSDCVENQQSGQPNDHGILNMIFYSSYLFLMLLNQGFICRGGISVGKMHHKIRDEGGNGDIVFGPALNEAHFIESSISIYPRICISDEIKDRFIVENLRQRQEYSKYTENIIRKDFDGVWHVNVFHPISHIPTTEILEIKPPSPGKGMTISGVDQFNAIKKAYQTGIEQKPKHRNPKVDMKYDWLTNYFNNSIRTWIKS